MFFDMEQKLRTFALAGSALAALGMATSGQAQTGTQPSTQFEYDANGNLTRIIDPLGRSTDNQYDRLNRPVLEYTFGVRSCFYSVSPSKAIPKEDQNTGRPGCVPYDGRMTPMTSTHAFLPWGAGQTHFQLIGDGPGPWIALSGSGLYLSINPLFYCVFRRA